MTLDLPTIRAQFSALSRPAGAQVAQRVVERMSEYEGA